MKFVILLIFSSIAGSTFGTDDKPTTSVPRSPRVIGGVDANIEDVPYQVSILRYYLEIENYSHFCGGSIINADTIITAAHCLVPRNASELLVRAGSDLRSQGGQLIQVRRIINHPDFKYYDISVMKLKGKLVFGSKVMPIDLPPKGFELTKGTPLLVSGWGAWNYKWESPERLQKAWLPYVPTEICAEKYKDDVGPHTICAGDTRLSACYGDSGGPLVYKKFLVGVVSGGYRCLYEGHFVRVSEFLGFITEAMAS